MDHSIHLDYSVSPTTNLDHSGTRDSSRVLKAGFTYTKSVAFFGGKQPPFKITIRIGSSRWCDDNLARLENGCRMTRLYHRYLIAIFFDLSNAFDKLWTGGAVMHLDSLGIKSTLLKWMGSFLNQITDIPRR